MSWSIEGLEVELKDLKKKVKQAYAAFCIARAELPIFPAYWIIAKSYRNEVQKYKFPQGKFLKDFETIRQKLIVEAKRLPEFSEYIKLRDEEKESRLVLIDAKKRYGDKK